MVKIDRLPWPSGQQDIRVDIERGAEDEEHLQPLLQPQGGGEPSAGPARSARQLLDAPGSSIQRPAPGIEVDTRSEPVKWPSAKLLSILWRSTRLPQKAAEVSFPPRSGHYEPSGPRGPLSSAQAGQRNAAADDLQIRQETDQTKNCLLLLMTALNNTDELKRLLSQIHLNPNISGLEAGDDLFGLQNWGLWESPALELIVNHMLDLNWTPLHVASARSQEACTYLLLNSLAKPNTLDLDNRTVLDVAGSLTDFDDEVQRKSFVTVIGLILHGGGRAGDAREMISPLHLAVEYKIQDVLEKLLNIEQYLATRDESGDTPLHWCMEMKYLEPIKILTNESPTRIYSRYGLPMILNIQNAKGYTVLHAAVEAGWMPGVWFAMEKGADILKKANDVETPIHLAADLGNLEILVKMLGVVNKKNLMDEMDDKGKNILFNALNKGHIDCVKAILRNTPSLIDHTLAGDENVFHVAAKKGYDDILQLLIDFYINICKKSFGEDKLALESLTETDGFGPIHYAVQGNHINCVDTLIRLSMNFKDKSDIYRLKTDKASVDTKLCEGSSPLHIAAKYNHDEIARLLLSYDNKQLRERDSQNELPLHVAINNGSRDVIMALLSEGANLADCSAADDPDIQTVKAEGGQTENGIEVGSSARQADIELTEITELGQKKEQKEDDKTTFIEMIINNLENPAQFLDEVFDSYITPNDFKTVHPDYEVKVDYKILMPDNREKSQMMVIEALLKTGDKYGQKKLLVHPIVESLLHLKWTALLPFFFIIIVIHAFFVMSLTSYTYAVFVYKHYDAKDFVMFESLSSSDYITAINNYILFWACILMSSICFMVLQECIIYEGVKGIQYLFQLETVVKLVSIALAIILVVSASIVDTEEVEWPRHIASVALLLAWIQIMILLSRIPKWGFYVLMFGKVALDVLKILVTFSFLIIGFALSFIILMKSESPFDTPIAALMKTMVMLTSEYDYGSFFQEEANQTTTNGTRSAQQPEFSALTLGVFRLIFFTFLVLVGIVLMNLMVGVAVNEISDLELLGNIQRLEKQAEFLISLDKLVYSTSYMKFLPKSMINKIKLRRNINNEGKLKPGKKRTKYDKMLTSEIREAILKNAEDKEKEDGNNYQQLKQLLNEAIAEMRHKNFDETGPVKDKDKRHGHKKVIDKLRKLDVTTAGGDEILKTITISTKEFKESKKP